VYLYNRKILSPLNVVIFIGRGVLYITSCNFPTGHIFPHHKRPPTTDQASNVTMAQIRIISSFIIFPLPFPRLFSCPPTINYLVFGFKAFPFSLKLPTSAVKRHAPEEQRVRTGGTAPATPPA
jgi:hypothetical protein